MPIRLNGINSGLDTETIVQALVSSYSYKKDKYTKAQTKLSWTQDAWKSLNTKVYSLYTNVSKLRFSSAYSLKKTTSSDTTKATVTAGNNATNGSQKLNILQTAQAGYLTGGKLGNHVTTSSTLAELGYTGGEGTINIDKGDGTSTSINVSSSTTVGEFIDQLKKQGLNASLDTTNHRMFVSAKNSGKENDFSLIGADSHGNAILSKLGLNVSLTTKDENGNDILTETGKQYEKYAALTKDSNGNSLIVPGDETLTDAAIKANITSMLDTYKDASSTYKDAQAQVSNLTSGLGYATAYAATRDFYTEKNITDIVRFNNVMSNYSESSTALVSSAGVVYNATTGTDQNGNTVYAGVGSDGKTTYVSKESLYQAEDGTTYRKTAAGDYISLIDNTTKFDGDTSKLTESGTNYYNVSESFTYDSTDKDGNKVSYSVTSSDVPDGEGGTKKQYSFQTADGKTYVSDSEEGTYKYTDSNGQEETLEIKKTYTYASQSPNHDLVQLKDAYSSYLTDKNISEEEASVFRTNLSKVNDFVGQVSDTESVTYSKKAIRDGVETAYANGGKSGVDAKVADYANEIAKFAADSQQALAAMETNGVVKNLVELSGDELDKAVGDLVTSAKSAVDILANGTNGAATKVDGQDAVIKLNGVEYQSASNAVSVNGLTINAQGITGDGDENAITIATSTDAQGIYDKIKDFLSEYNSIINEMCKLYNAGSSKGYEPLTDDEKSAMSDKEIEKWESKIKDSLLRRDSTLGGVMNAMTNAMMKGISINGKTYSLSSFGIKTLGYLNAAENENYAYHIDGDEDDTNTSGNTDRLMAMINEDPDTVMSFFQQLTSNLYQTIGDKMQRTSLSSGYTIYNDKQMTKQYSEYTSLIKKWEEKLADKEDYYYKKFSAMESAMAKLNSTQSSMGGFFS